MRINDVRIEAEQWPLREPFSFSGFTVEALDAVHVTVSDGIHRGHGEGVVPVVFDISLSQTLECLSAARSAILAGSDALETCAGLPPGPARNALDCALWDLMAKAGGRSVWDMAGLGPAPAAIAVDQSIGLADPATMAARAAASSHAVLKIKLDTAMVEERLAAVRAARPDAAIIVDANQAWSPAELVSFAPRLADLRVSMIEQPLRVGIDGALSGLRLAVPVYADESCHTASDLPRLAGLYDGINIKLDKAGGLTEALALARAAKAMGLGLMVGCMAGTSLSMAPAYVIASLCNWADLDGPLLLANDRPAAMSYRAGKLECFTPDLWG
jgi:L-alanine-DL-glutamate epimerase-like enolase superfamily enzyme